MRSSASGKTRSGIRPGAVVPAAAAEAATRGPGEAGECERDSEHQPVALGTDDLETPALHAHRSRRRADRVAVGVDDEWPVRAHLDHPTAQQVRVGRIQMGAREDLGEVA